MKIIELVDNVILEYWEYFQNDDICHYNDYYLDNIRYMKNDWVSENDWISNAKKAIKNNKNIIQSLEILLNNEFETYENFAKEFLYEWTQKNIHDVECHYYLLALLKKSDPMRQSFFTKDYYTLHHLYGAQKDIEALIKVDDLEFCSTYGKYLENIIIKNKDCDDKLEHIIYFSSNFALKASKFMSLESLNILKNLVLKYIQNDKTLAEEYLLEGHILEQSRTHWIYKDIASIAWFWGWLDILDYLKKEEWYWLYMFDSEYCDDLENINLLIWSKYMSNDLLKERATYILLNSRYLKLDGAIAWKRLLYH